MGKAGRYLGVALLVVLASGVLVVWQISRIKPFYDGYFTNQVEAHVGDVGADVEFCMRVIAEPEEIEAFVAALFDAEHRVSAEVDKFGLACLADFWPATFSNETTAYESLRAGSRGVVVEGGYFYYWDNEI